MASPQENTKIERVTESIESLIVASIRLALAQSKVPSVDEITDRNITEIGNSHRGVTDARAEMATSLRELLKPTLRVVEREHIPAPGARPVYPSE